MTDWCQSLTGGRSTGVASIRFTTPDRLGTVDPNGAVVGAALAVPITGCVCGCEPLGTSCPDVELSATKLGVGAGHCWTTGNRATPAVAGAVGRRAYTIHSFLL